MRGVLVANVLDIVERDDVDFKIAILDMSFNAHMPDFLLSPDLDMPVTGADIVRDASELKKHEHVYRLAGGTCVSGDQLGAVACVQRAAEAGRQGHHGGLDPLQPCAVHDVQRRPASGHLAI